MTRDGLFVYFAQVGTRDRVKIGYSADPIQRMASLIFNHRMNEFRLLGFVPGDWTEERAYHRQFASHRRTGSELFRLAPIRAEIERLTSGLLAHDARQFCLTHYTISPMAAANLVIAFGGAERAATFLGIEADTVREWLKPEGDNPIWLVRPIVRGFNVAAELAKHGKAA